MYSGLNHIYRLVWDHVREAWVPVAEHCKSAGRTGVRRAALTGKLAILAIAVLPPVLQVAYAGTSSVSDGDIVIGEVLDSASDVQIVYNGGTANSTIVSNKGAQHLSSGGIANNTILNSAGVQVIFDGGTANLTEINNAGKQSISSGGYAYSTTVHSGGNQYISSGGSADFTILEGGTQTLSSGGTANVTTINNGGIQYIKGGGTATSTTINGGSQNISSGGSATSTTINGGGVQTIYNGGIANTTILDGGAQVVYGAANATEINSGGYISIASGGLVTNAILNDGAILNLGGSTNGTIVNGGTYTQGSDDDATLTALTTASDLTVNSGGSAYIYGGTVTGTTTIRGEMSLGSTTDGSAPGALLEGDVTVEDNGLLTVAEGAHTENADITLSDSGALYLTNAPSVTASTTANTTQYTMGAMTMDGGSVHFDDENGYADLTLDSLNGTGSFYMNTEVATLQGDHLTVTGEANGDYDVYIKDSGVSPTSDSSLEMISTGGGNAEFTLANTGGVVDVGTYQYQLVDNGNDTWSLTPYTPTEPPVEPVEPPVEPVEPPVEPVEPPVEPVEPPVEPVEPPVEPVTPPSEMTISPSTAAVLSMATANPLIFKAELDIVRDRMDLVRSASRGTEISHDTNLWAHYNFNNFGVSSSAGASYDMTVSGFTLGMDRSLALENATATFGGFTSYSRSDLDFDRGGNGDVDSYSIGAYASYLHNNGFYADSILKANRFGNDVHAQMTSGSAAYGDYNTNGIGMHLQGGKYFYFGESYIAPYVALSTFTSDSSDYTLSNDMRARVDKQKSMIGEAGVQMGHHFEYNGAKIQPYFRAAVAQEFVDDNKVRVNDDTFTNDLSGARGVYQVGVNAQVTKTLAVNAHTSYSHGDHVDEPLTVNLGVSWKF